MSKQIDAVRRKRVLDYIKDNYSLLNYLRELNLWDDGPTVIKCPFHPDSRPSFNIDIENQKFKCFSCGKGGGYISFYHEYHISVVEDDKNFNSHVEEILNNDITMQKDLGFNTIFIKLETRLSLKDIINFKHKQHNYVNVDTRSLETIRRKLIKEENIEELLDFFADIERGKAMDELWSKYYLGIKVDNIHLDLEKKTELEDAFSSLLDEIIEEPAFTNVFEEVSNNETGGE